MKYVRLKVFLRVGVLDGVVLCLHSSTIVTSSRVHSDVFSEEGGVDLKLAILIKLRIILLKKLHGLIVTIMVEWKLTTFLGQEPWLDAPPRTRGVARLRAARGATGDPTRVWWWVQPRLLTQKRGQFLQLAYQYVSFMIGRILGCWIAGDCNKTDHRSD